MEENKIPKLQFKFTEADDTIVLSFSDGNVIIADDAGISTYNTNKTVHFKSKDVEVQSSYIESRDEDGVIVWILPADETDDDLGLQNDVKLASSRKVRSYRIPEQYFEKIKELLWMLALKKFDS